MSNNTVNKNSKRRVGELLYKEGISNIKDFLKDLASNIIKRGWIPYINNKSDLAWAFNVKREIYLREAFKKENIKLYKATLNPVDNTWQKGELINQSEYIIIQNIIRGINNTATNGTQINDRVLIEIQYNDEIFELSTILERYLPSGQELPYAQLKSRPQGDISVYKERIIKMTDEPLHQEGGNEIYLLGKSPISPAKDKQYTLQVKKNGEVVQPENYVVDYWNGVIQFNQQLQPSDNVTATYGFKTGIREELIDKSKYKRNQNKIIDVTSLQELKNQDIVVDVDYYWTLEYPSNVESITDRILLSTKVDISNVGDRVKLKTYYLEIRYKDYESGNSSKEYRTGVEMRFGSKLKQVGDSYSLEENRIKAKGRIQPRDDSGKTLDDLTASAWAKFSWYKNTAFDDGVVFEDWLPIHFKMNFTTEYLNLFIHGDQSPDFGQQDNESHYLMSWAYIGMLDSFERAEYEDLENNFGMTVGSGEPPNLDLEQWGELTGNGITDFVMEKTISNIPMQGHLPAFQTPFEFMEKKYITFSQYTGYYHFSQITITHPSLRERGKMRSVLVGDISAMFHLDELILDKDTFDLRGALINGTETRNECGSPILSEETRWIHTTVNSPYWLLNNSGNVLYGIVLRKE